MSKDRMLKKGDNVVMHTCGEATFPKYFGKVWKCKTDEFITGEGKGLYEQRLVFLEGFSGSFATDYLQYIELELASPDAIKTTEQPSKAAAVEGILTEEELNTCENTLGSNYWAMQAALEKVIASHRNLLSANAEKDTRNRLLVLENDELNIENQKLKSALNGIVNGNWACGWANGFEVWTTDRINPRKIALEALEELK